MNLIQEECDEINFYTSLRCVRDWLGIDLKDYDWYLSDLDVMWDKGIESEWVTGERLDSIILEYDYQFNWGLFRLFKKVFAKQLNIRRTHAETRVFGRANRFPKLKVLFLKWFVGIVALRCI